MPEVPASVMLELPNLAISAYQGVDALGGEDTSLSTVVGQGKPVVLNFWAALCPPCRAEMPEFERVHEERSDEVTILGIDIGPQQFLGTREEGQELLNELGVTYPAGTTFDDTVVRGFEIFGMPTTFFIGADGSVMRKWSGILDEEKLNELVDELLGEAPVTSSEQASGETDSAPQFGDEFVLTVGGAGRGAVAGDVAMNDMPAADGDGHVLENAKRIAELLDEPYRGYRVGSNASPDVMPIEPLTPLDGMPRSLGASRVGGRAYSAEDWLAALDRGPLEWSAVYPTLGLYAGYVRDPAYQATLCRAYNDWLAETFYPHCDGRILGVALLPTLDPAAAAAELHRAAGLGHAGVMFPADGTHLLGHASYDVVYEAAREARLPVAVHASGSPFAPGAEIFPTFIQAHSVATRTASSGSSRA